MPKEGIDNLKNQIEQYLNEANINNIKLIQQGEKIIEIAKLIKDSNTIFIAGNGGSAATASHFANDLQKICGKRAFCLTDNIPLVTAYSNDCGYETIFEEQLQTLCDEDDTIIIISGSGDSINIYNTIDSICKNKIAFIGMNGGNILGNEKYGGIKTIHIESDMLHSEDWHLTLCHLITTLIKENE